MYFYREKEVISDRSTELTEHLTDSNAVQIHKFTLATEEDVVQKLQSTFEPHIRNKSSSRTAILHQVKSYINFIKKIF